MPVVYMVGVNWEAVRLAAPIDAVFQPNLRLPPMFGSIVGGLLIFYGDTQMSEIIPQNLSELTKDELKALFIKIQLLLELQEKFVFVPIAQAQGDNA